MDFSNITLFFLQLVLILLSGTVVIILIHRSLDLLAQKAHLSTLSIQPLRLMTKWLGIIIIVALILSKFGIDILAGVYTVLAMIAIGFIAIWSVLSHLLSTLLLILFKPFSVGDEIEFAGEDVKGRVIDLTLFYTTLQDETGILIQIPNNLFFQKVLKRRIGAVTTNLEQQLEKESPVN